MNAARIARAAVAVLAFSCLPAPSSALELPPAPGSPVASFDTGSLHVDEYGSGSPSDAVILIPGLAAGPWEWYGAIAHLAPKYRVYVVTLPGFDGRPPAEIAGHVFSTTDRSLLELIERERLVRPVVVGHDLGAAIALAFAINDPRAMRAIVAVDGLPVSLTLAYLPPVERRRQADFAAASETRDPTMIRPMALQNVATTGAIDADLTNAILDHQESADNTGLAIAMRELLATDLRPDLRRITVPVLVMVPYYLPDNSTPPGIVPPVVHTQAQKIADYEALYPDAKTVTFVPVAPARHFIMLDAPGAFASALDAFLAAHPG